MAAWKQSFCAGDPCAAAAAWVLLSRRAADPGPLGHRLGVWRDASRRDGSGRPGGGQATSRAGSGGRQTAVVTADSHHGDHQRPAVGDRHRPGQRLRRRQPLRVRPADRGRGRRRAPRSRTASHRQARFRGRGDRPRPRQDRARRRAGEARARQARCALQHGHHGAGDRSRTGGRQCRLALRDAELALERRSIVAPIAGIVGILPVEAGNYVTSQTAIATIDDRSSIIVDFWVPERFAGHRQGRRAADRVADRPPRRRLRRHGQRRRQPHRRGRAARCGCRRRIANARRHAARRHVVPGHDAVSRRHLSGGQPAGHPVGLRRRLRLDGRRRQGQAHAGAHRPAQHRDRAGRRADSGRATSW